MATNTDKAIYTQFRIKCMECGLHFVVCSWFPERHAMTTLYCPECGQHNAHFYLYRFAVEGYIFQLVPGEASFADRRLPHEQ